MELTSPTLSDCQTGDPDSGWRLPAFRKKDKVRKPAARELARLEFCGNIQPMQNPEYRKWLSIEMNLIWPYRLHPGSPSTHPDWMYYN